MNNREIINISGVDCYEKDGIVYLNLETVARGLGFTTVAASGNEVVRWNTVYKYLSDLGVATSCNGADYRSMCPDYIPENIFYRLAMKAKNETAEAFQAKIADEVIPQIRRTGAYRTKSMTQNELIAAMAQANVEQERKILALEERADRNEEMLTELANVFDVPTCPDRGHWQEEMNCRINSICQSYELNYQSFRKRLYERLELQLGVDLEARQRNLKKRLKESGAKYDEVQKVSKLHVISRDASLRAAFELIVRSEAARCLTGKEARQE